MIIAGDIGGTNVRLAYFDKAQGREPLYLEKYASRDFSDFSSLLKKFINGLGKKEITAACFGIAGPVQEGRCQATNLPWVVDVKLLSQDLGIPKVFLINDLEANAWGISILRPEEFLVLNQGRELEGNAALISAGTGLGEAGLYWNGKEHLPFACEGGHCDFAPRNEEEIELWSYLKQKFEHVSYERILSGSGIYQIYRFLIDSQREKSVLSSSEVEDLKEPQKVITEMALKKQCPACIHALNLFSSVYGSEAGNIALKMLATHAVYVGGGIAPTIASILKEGHFMKAFVAKGRFMPMLSNISVKVLLNDQTALLGAARYGSKKS